MLLTWPDAAQLPRATLFKAIVRRCTKALLTALALTILPHNDAAAQTDAPVQVFIMMGQSNMVGLGNVNGGSDGTLEYAVNTKGLYPYLSDGSGGWAQRDDVRFAHVQSSALGNTSYLRNEWITPGGSGKMGPEYGIAQLLGNAVDAPVLLLKSAIGNRSLGWDLLPPGSEQYQWIDPSDGTHYTYAGYGDSPLRWETGTTPTPISWRAGIQYDGDTRNAESVLDDFESYYPGETEYQVAGFFYWQGDKDRYNAGHAERYEQNMVQFIDQVRQRFNAPDAPFVLATLGQNETGVATGNDGLIHAAQLAVDGDAGNYPQFAGNVDTVYTHPLSLGGASNSHYNGNAETYMNVGEAMGQSMADMFRYRAYLQVDRQTGEVTIVNPFYGNASQHSALDLTGYTITSDSGALIDANWTSITDAYDADNGGQIDPDDTWAVTTAAINALGESANGGDGGSLLVDDLVSLGVGVWLPNPDEDIQFAYTDDNGVVQPLSVRYVGDKIKAGDYDLNGTIGGADFAIFMTGAQADLSALSSAQAYQMGDLYGDGDNDIYDFDLFRQAFELDNPGAGAFEAMVENYLAPEPGSLVLLGGGMLLLGMRRRREAESARSSKRGTATTAGPAKAAALALSLLAACTTQAAGFTFNAIAPAVDQLDIANLATPTGGQLIWTDRDVQGQTFTTGTQWGMLNAITVQVQGKDGIVPGWKDYRLRFGIVTPGINTTINPLVDQVTRQPGDTPTDSFFTFTLDTPIALSPQTVYGFDIGLAGSEDGWSSGIPQLLTTGSTFAGGQGYNAGRPSNPGNNLSTNSTDKLFHADIDTVAGSGLLTMRINTTSGEATLLGGSVGNTNINYYQITSDADSLDVTGWRSLQDQDFEGNGPPTGIGNGWEEAGGSGAHALAEGYLLGDSTLATGGQVLLGAAYDEQADARDLVFTYRIDTGQIFDGNVEYFSPLLGDVNNDGNVNGDDIADALIGYTGANASLSSSWATGDMNADGDVDNSDIGVIIGELDAPLSYQAAQRIYGQTAFGQASLRSLGLTVVPEPASLALFAVAGLFMLGRRRKQAAAAALACCVTATTHAATTHTATGGEWNNDTWNDPASWDNGAGSVPTGSIDVVIGAGNSAGATAITPSYDGSLTLLDNARLVINGGDASLLNVFGSSTINLHSGSSIVTRYGSFDYTQAFNLLGDATVATGASTSGHHSTKTFAGPITGGFGFTLQGVNNNTINLNATNTFASFTADRAFGTNFKVHANAAGALGSGNVTINDTVTLVIDQPDAITDTASLFLNGAQSSKGSVASKLVMNADDTIERLFIDGSEIAPGTYTNDDAPWISGGGSLTVLAPNWPTLAIQANTTSGELRILGSPNGEIAFNFYQVTSDAESLEPNRWRSMQDQDYEGNGPPTGVGNGWEEAGGSGAHALAEGYLLGDSVLTTGETIALGGAYDHATDARDLAMLYRTQDGRIFDGVVEYFSPLLGDVNNDGSVDSADLSDALIGYTGANASLDSSWTTGDMNADGDVDNADIGIVLGQFDGVLSAFDTQRVYEQSSFDAEALRSFGIAVVPEPASLGVLCMGGLLISARRNRRV